MKTVRSITAMLAICGSVAGCATNTEPSVSGHTEQDYYVGQLRILAGETCPDMAVAADGTPLPIARYQELFLIFGTRYGGDGRTTFAVPNLSSASLMGAGTSQSGIDYPLFGTGGRAEATRMLPRHSHTFSASSSQANTSEPQENILPTSASTENIDRYASRMGSFQERSFAIEAMSTERVS